MTKEQKAAIKRICADYDFEDLKELREYMRENYDDPLDLDLWDKSEDGLYKEISKFIERGLFYENGLQRQLW